jgi:DNA end-binding protein Ku
MPRASGTLTISFGLVNVGVKYAPLIETKSGRLSGKFVDPDTRQPVTQQYVNEAGVAVEKVTGYPHGDEFIVLGEGDKQGLKAERSGRLDVQALVDPSAVDPVLFEKSNVVWPDKGHETSYDVLCAVLEETGKCLVGTTVFDSTRAIVLRYVDGCLLAHVCRYDALVRWGHRNAISSAQAERPDPDPALVDMALQVFSTLPGTFDFSAVADDYDQRLRAAVEAAAQGKPVPKAPEVEATPVEDLMEALKATVAAKGQPEKKATRKKKVAA